MLIVFDIIVRNVMNWLMVLYINVYIIIKKLKWPNSLMITVINAWEYVTEYYWNMSY